MYKSGQGLIFGFHGCDRSVAEKVVNAKESLRKSQNSYDWLGHGVYFWENSYERALEFATYLSKNPARAKHPIKDPAVIGAVLSLGNCFDLTQYENLQLLKEGYLGLCENSVFQIPINKKGKGSQELLMRELDCAVIQYLHEVRKENNLLPFDSVRGMFFEGDDLYPNAGFKEKNHIQICIINPNCIKGYFIPRVLDEKYSVI